MLTKIKTNEKGFTLIELMIVVAIIGILAILAIPQFTQFKYRAFESSVMNDMRNIKIAEEAYFIDNATYTNNMQDLLNEGLTLASTSQIKWGAAATGNLATEYSFVGYDERLPRDVNKYYYISNASAVDEREDTTFDNQPGDSVYANGVVVTP